MDEVEDIIKQINECKNRNEAAELYAEMLSNMKCEFKPVNEAIIKKWSLAGLIYIKERAWGMI